MLDDVLVVLQRAEMTTRMASEIERNCVELGEEGRLIRMQLDELMEDVPAREGRDRLRLRALGEPGRRGRRRSSGSRALPYAAAARVRGAGRAARLPARGEPARPHRRAARLPRPLAASRASPRRSSGTSSATSAASTRSSARASASSRRSTASARCARARSARACAASRSTTSSTATSSSSHNSPALCRPRVLPSRKSLESLAFPACQVELTVSAESVWGVGVRSVSRGRTGLYEVGDKVVYPHHGAGRVVKKETRDRSSGRSAST